MSDIEVKANGVIGKWILGIVGTLAALGVVGAILTAIAVGRIEENIGWIREALVEVKAAAKLNDTRIDRNDRRLDKLEAGR